MLSTGLDFVDVAAVPRILSSNWKCPGKLSFFRPLYKNFRKTCWKDKVIEKILINFVFLHKVTHKSDDWWLDQILKKDFSDAPFWVWLTAAFIWYWDEESCWAAFWINSNIVRNVVWSIDFEICRLISTKIIYSTWINHSLYSSSFFRCRLQRRINLYQSFFLINAIID